MCVCAGSEGILMMMMCVSEVRACMRVRACVRVCAGQNGAGLSKAIRFGLGF